MLFVMWCASPAFCADIHVDPVSGNDGSPTGPVKTIHQAISRARPGDTIHLKPMIYREYAGFYGKQGEPGKPITLDGHGATLEGSEPLQPDQWVEEEPGLFRCDQLLPRLNDAIIQRWFFLWDGRMVHMGRTSKGPRAPLKKKEDLLPGEWTFLKSPPSEESQSQEIQGAFYLKLKPGEKLGEAKIFVPVRSAGVQMSGTSPKHNAHLVIRNLTATHVYNDGFNIHGHCEDILFENIKAIECGDDGISAHETAEYRVDGFVSIGNSTGICDTGSSRTQYNRVYIRDCVGFDLYFLDQGNYSVSNAVVLSSAWKMFHLTGRESFDQPAKLSMENVLLRRTASLNEFRVSKYTQLDAERLTIQGASVNITGGSVSMHHSEILKSVLPANGESGNGNNASTPGVLTPELVITEGSGWTANQNRYELERITYLSDRFTPAMFSKYQQVSKQDLDSHWEIDAERIREGGVDFKLLNETVVTSGEPELRP